MHGTSELKRNPTPNNPNGAVCILLQSNEKCTVSHSKYPETSSEFFC